MFIKKLMVRKLKKIDSRMTRYILSLGFCLDSFLTETQLDNAGNITISIIFKEKQDAVLFVSKKEGTANPNMRLIDELNQGFGRSVYIVNVRKRK